MFQAFTSNLKTLVCAIGFITALALPVAAEEFRVEGAGLEAVPTNYRGACPGLIKFQGKIQASARGRVKYIYFRSDGATGPEGFVDFEGSGVKTVETTWTLGGVGLTHYAGWVAIRIISPNSYESNRANFVVDCQTGQTNPQPGGGGQSGPVRARFRVTMNGFTVNHETWDNALELDGVRDEIFLVNPASFLIDTTGRVLRRQVGAHGPVFGQRRTPTSAAIQAGSATPTGGLRTGDMFPSPEPWTGGGRPVIGLGIPHQFFDGEITQGANALAIIPSLWEWDDNDNRLHFPYEDMTTDPSVARSVPRFITSPPGTGLSDFIKNGSELGMPLRVSIGHGPVGLGEANNRPIGMIRSGDRYVFDPKVLVLTYEMADMVARTDFGRGNGVIEMRYQDDRDLAGDYTLYIKVERVP
jgi:hypothetical protein